MVNAPIADLPDEAPPEKQAKSKAELQRVCVSMLSVLWLCTGTNQAAARGPRRAVLLPRDRPPEENLAEGPAGDPALPANVRPKGPDALALLRRYAAVDMLMPLQSSLGITDVCIAYVSRHQLFLAWPLDGRELRPAACIQLWRNSR